MSPLDVEEQEILESLENGEWQSVPNLMQEIQRYQSYAQAVNLESINIELPTSDFQSLWVLSEQTGISVKERELNKIRKSSLPCCQF
jgi:predicted DNA binding CopG/RHH family protein